MDYQRRWSASDSVAGFGQGICDVWASEYSAWAGLDPADVVAVDPGNAFSYLFDLAGTLRGKSCARAPRVVGVWGLSQPQAKHRDRSRMRRHARPGRHGYDRGHLISCAARERYDINLMPIEATSNRGWSPEGSRFRALERRDAGRAGTLFSSGRSTRTTANGRSDSRPKYKTASGQTLLFGITWHVRQHRRRCSFMMRSTWAVWTYWRSSWMTVGLGTWRFIRTSAPPTARGHGQDSIHGSPCSRIRPAIQVPRLSVGVRLTHGGAYITLGKESSFGSLMVIVS